MSSLRWFVFLFCASSLTAHSVVAMAGDKVSLPAESVQFFESKIRPVLVEHCYRCHSADGQGVRAGLAVDNRDALLAGGESGPAIVPGNLEESILWNAINYKDYRMPPKNPLPKAVIEDFRKWIEMGAPDPRVSTGVVVHSKVTAEDIKTGKQFWSFQSPTKVLAMESKHKDWAVTEIDRQIAEVWEKHDLSPAEDTDPASLIRRIHFDLIGLPPSNKELDSFVANYKRNPAVSIDQVVDDLLQRPQFGERWGRHWLDVARYAESSGKEVDMTFPNAWRYRDYVIDSFNSDKPYDQFVREQIAGDLLPTRDDRKFAEQLIATGFLAIGPKALIEQNPRQFQADLIDEQIDTTTRVLLGLSVGCARCHDHKFDPIPQTDYYAMAGIFQSTETLFGGMRSIRNRQPSKSIILPINAPSPYDKTITKTELASLQKQLEDREKEYIEARRAQRQPAGSKEDKNPRSSFLSVAILDQIIAQLSSRIHSVDSDGKPLSMCMGVQSSDRPRDAKLLVRGEIDQPAQEVKRGLLQVLSKDGGELKWNNAQGTTSSLSNNSEPTGRRALAEWLASRENPLTARVMVNRVWQHLMGKAIVREPDNFGASGPAPTHPALLDFLATEFMDQAWSVKKIVRAIVTSRVYRLSSSFDRQRFEADPENLYWARANVRRLDAEAIRDAILALGGQLELTRPKASVMASFGTVQLGPNGPIAIPQAVLNGEGRSAIAGAMRNGARNVNPFEASNYHRSVYLPIARNSLPRALDVFDFAEPSLVVGDRETSNTADQALFMLNNPFVIEQSDAIARQLIRASSNQGQRVALGFQQILGRSGTEKEIRAASDFLRKTIDFKNSLSQEQKIFQALSQFCQALLCSAEFRLLN